MRRFMSTNFPKISPVHVNMFSDKDGQPSVNGFVQVVDDKCARKIVEHVKDKSLKVSGFDGVKVGRAKSAIDRNRDWALARAEELVKAHPAASSKLVKKEYGGEDKVRGIYVDGVRVFEQPGRFSKDGVFLLEFSSLQLR